MAATEYGVNHPLAVKLWAKKLLREALKQTWAYKFMGMNTNSVIYIKDDTQKAKGDRIRVGLRMLLQGAGVQGDGTLEGNEEQLVTYTDDVLIDQIRHAVRSGGRMSEQRVPFEVRDEARVGLQDWFADRIDTWFMNQIAGNTAQTNTLFTGNNAVSAPDAAHILRPLGSAADEDLSDSSTQAFSLNLIDNAVELAYTASPAIRPVRIGGEDHFVMFLHDYQVTDLRTNTDTGQWLDIQKSAMQGGQVSKSPIFTGALGMYNGVILHRSNRIPLGVNSSNGASVSGTRRAVLCGAQAACMAFGRENGPDRMHWVEELFDYENELGVSAGTIAGLKKTRFNDADFSTVVVTTVANAHNS